MHTCRGIYRLENIGWVEEGFPTIYVSKRLTQPPPRMDRKLQSENQIHAIYFFGKFAIPCLIPIYSFCLFHGILSKYDSCLKLSSQGQPLVVQPWPPLKRRCMQNEKVGSTLSNKGHCDVSSLAGASEGFSWKSPDACASCDADSCTDKLGQSHGCNLQIR